MRFLIDQGSELSFITEDFVKRLCLTRTRASIPLLGIGGLNSGRTRGKVDLHLQSIHDPINSCTIQAYILPQLTSQLPSSDIEQQAWPHLHGLQLADPDYGRPGPIHLLIGSDFYGQIIKPDMLKGNLGSPIAQLTTFGWILSGPTNSSENSSALTGYHCAADQELIDLLTKFWHQEEVKHSDEISLNPEETFCENHYRTTYQRDNTGRYTVRLPIKASVSSLGNSEKRALHCLKRLRRRFDAEPIYHQLYSDVIQEYKTLGHLTTIPTSEIKSSLSYYLPHHGIFKEDRKTTKLRIVFNGSSRTTTGVSLNDILHIGPKLQTDISNVLLWIRLHRFIFSTDITKMYRQINVHRDDWDLQRIFWYDSNQQIIPCRLTTVTFGLNCAPYLALRTLQQLIQDEEHRFPLAIPALTKGRYVDDIFGGAESIQDTQAIIRQLIELMTAGGFPLQKWTSNNQEVLSNISKISSDTTSSVQFESTHTKLLGLIWQTDSDNFTFSSCVPPPKGLYTKRSILSEIAQLFDPLGLIAPITVRAKIFMQELWTLQIGWDDPLPQQQQHQWKTFRQQLQILGELHCPRWLNTSSTARLYEIHGFSDASQLAMAAVIYIKAVHQDETVSITLVEAKTRVAPLKKLTIPRLELTASLMLTRLADRVQRALDLRDVSIFLWTDSSVTLTWLSAHPSRWKDFVRNRVVNIQETLPRATWRFVPGKDNPADCASRGIKVEHLKTHYLWWNGPEWLRLPSSQWPVSNISPTSIVDLEERTGNLLTVSNASTPSY